MKARDSFAHGNFIAFFVPMARTIMTSLLIAMALACGPSVAAQTPTSPVTQQSPAPGATSLQIAPPVAIPSASANWLPSGEKDALGTIVVTFDGKAFGNNRVRYTEAYLPGHINDFKKLRVAICFEDASTPVKVEESEMRNELVGGSEMVVFDLSTALRTLRGSGKLMLMVTARKGVTVIKPTLPEAMSFSLFQPLPGTPKSPATVPHLVFYAMAQ
jgi:hypothetical protein